MREGPNSPLFFPLDDLEKTRKLLKLNFNGNDAILRTIEITTWVQVHPASLPSLRKGKNKMRYVTGDHHGQETHVVEIRTNGSDRADFLKFLSDPPKDFDPTRTASRARGQFTAKVTAPPGMKVAWFSAGGNFTAHQGEAAPRTGNAMAWSAEASGPFHEFYRANVPAGQNHWHYNADVEVKLDAPQPTVFLRYTADPGINNLRLFAHCLDNTPSMKSPVTITHAWREKGELKTKSLSLNQPGAYEVTTDDDPVDEYVELSIPSGAR